jgi:pyridoxal phosphate enzyme (YggS family)
LQENVARVRERIAAAAQRAGRTTATDIVAVTKGHSPRVVAAARAAGLLRLGENRVQELEEKRTAGGPGIEWHLIGHLQRNKVKRALPLFDLLHSLDSLRLAEELSREAERAGSRVPLLVQVNVAGEETKGGFTAADVPDAVGQIASLPNLQILGLMIIAPYTDDEQVLRRTFAAGRQLSERCSAVNGFEARHLSMGMSNDFEIAVEEGSTLLRLGTVLFGERS